MFQTKWWAYQRAESCMTGEFLRKMERTWACWLKGARGASCWPQGRRGEGRAERAVPKLLFRLADSKAYSRCLDMWDL